MYHNNDKYVLETDDFKSLLSVYVTTATDGTQLAHLTFRLDGRKVYNPGEHPLRVLLTEGVTPRYMSAEGYAAPDSE